MMLEADAVPASRSGWVDARKFILTFFQGVLSPDLIEN